MKKIWKILIIILSIIGVIGIISLFFFNSTTNKQDDPQYSSAPSMSKEFSNQESEGLKGTSGLIQTVTGDKIVTTNEFDENAYRQISYDNFVQYIRNHYSQKRKTDFKGISIFQESYRLVFDLPYKPVLMSAGMESTLLDAVGTKQVADAFTHSFTINIDGINFYYFIQEKLALEIINKWSETNKYELFIFIPFTNHFDEYVTILVNATNDL